MTDAVNNHLIVGCLVKDEIGVGRCRHPAQRRIARACADERMQQQEIDHRLDAGFDAQRALRRLAVDMIEDRRKLGQRR